MKIISLQPGNPDCVLIGYQQGLIALWDIKKLVVISTFISSQVSESIHVIDLNFKKLKKKVIWNHTILFFILEFGVGGLATPGYKIYEFT